MGNSNKKNDTETASKPRKVKVQYNNVGADTERINDVITRIIKNNSDGIHPVVKIHVTLEYAIQPIPK